MLSKKQQIEIKCLDYFARDIGLYIRPVNDINVGIKMKKDINGLSPEKCYFLIGDSGIKNIETTNISRLRQLLDTKKWRLRMMHEYEHGILSGCYLGYHTILGFEPELKKRKFISWLLSWLLRRSIFKELPCRPVPECVMDFIARTIFQGEDEQLIRTFYKENIK